MTGRQVSLAPVWLTREQFFVVVHDPASDVDQFLLNFEKPE
jgi:hypothetical protein